MSLRVALALAVGSCVFVGLLAGCGGGGGGGAVDAVGQWLPRLFFTASPATEVGVRLDGPVPAGAALSYRTQGSTGAYQAAVPEREGFWRLLGLPGATSFDCRLGAPSTPDRLVEPATAPGPLDAFTFAAYADSRNGDVPHQALLYWMRTRNPRFVLHGGDLVELGDQDADWDHYLPLLQPLAAEAPFVLAMGNHEANLAKYLARFGAEPSGGNPWFSFDHGALRVIVLSTFDATPDPLQTSFLTGALAGGPAIKVVMFHEPFDGPWRGPSAKGTAYQTAWKGLIESPSAGVRLVIWGHDHLYARRLVGSTTYILSGAGGSPFHSSAPYAASWDFVAVNTYEALVVTVTPGSVKPLRVEVVQDDGTLLEPAFDL